MTEALTLAMTEGALVRPVSWGKHGGSEWIKTRDDADPVFFVTVDVQNGNEWQMAIYYAFDLFGEWEVKP